MEWRCEWCGKPHDEDDPPCDNCGHGQFEKAVVRQTDLADEGNQEATIVWACTDCGREHPKHAPPCSRCGNPTLEKQRQHVDQAELSAPGYLDLVTPRYILALGVTLAVASVVVLGLVGVLDVPGFDQGGVPGVDDVPGNATATGGVALADVEAAYVAALNEELDRADGPQLDRSDHLDEVSTFYNQRLVKTLLADGNLPEDQRVSDLLGEECRRGTPITFSDEQVTVDGSETAPELGQTLATAVVEAGFEPVRSATVVGVDVHAVDGQLFLGQFVCEA
ncbi:hypothetical protein SAMN05216226_101115 [Halovenus aranensis]|uniref:Zinc-ribbon domain-containing protein n=1 Tax=Halovenus aranensis TaxID=890420 RepID=A0A1G8RTR3_9EURY|nr:hypothetical protein [Halovenus aranensis]SDJ20323.1 hypothetical protein SAMN05216226_101115 [Halovenus aranensis]